MSRHNSAHSQDEAAPVADGRQRRWHVLRPRRPTSVWGWLLWLLVVLLFYLLIFYVLVPWYQPAPTDVPPLPPNSSPGRT
jgi:hypothetical protein